MTDETKAKVRRLCLWAQGHAHLAYEQLRIYRKDADEILAELDAPRVGEKGVHSIKSIWSAEDGLKVEVERFEEPAAWPDGSPALYFDGVLVVPDKYKDPSSPPPTDVLPDSLEGTFEITLGIDNESATVDGEPVPLDELWAKLVKAGQVVVPFEPPGYLGIEVTYPGPKYYRMSLGRTEGLNWTQFCHAVLTVLENHRAHRAHDLAEEKTA